MWFSNGQCFRLCPVSLGFALGLTSALALIVWAIWTKIQGVPPMMADVMPALTFMNVLIHALWAFARGFVFGFLIALFYDFCCWCKEKCYKKSV
ncbi:MAG: hypothetical protein A3F14_03475 [Gammaproteobacteria bacterium RIFCSPHIGHO2_12_FULL_43_28]|nr:MAG: hypothetical protein A3F14_03475 [Gammaproteobacteria bacterium RIFCSPHIGHO2_12_FULL_43_28]